MSTKSHDKIFESDSSEKQGFRKEVFETIFMAYRPYLLRIIFVLFCGLGGRILILGSSNLIGIWVDTFCKAPAICKPLPEWARGLQAQDFISRLVLMCLLGFGLTVIFRVVFSRLSAHAVSQIYDEVTFRTSRYSMSFFDKTPAGRIMTRFSSDYGNVFRIFGGPLAEFIAIVFDLVVMIVLMGLASPYFLIFVGIIILLNYWTYKINRQKLRISRRALSAARSPSIAHFSETTVGASTIRTFLKQDSFKKRFQELDDYYLNHRLKTVFQVVGFSFQMNALSSLLLLMTGVGSLGLVKQGIISVGGLGVAFSLIVLSGNTVQMFFEWLAQFEEAMVGMERLDEYLRRPLEKGNFLPAKAQFPTNHPRIMNTSENPWKNLAQSSIEFKNVKFKYYPEQPWVLNNVSFKVEAGEHLGVIGSTGSGKSTLIQVLFQFYSLSEGDIFINDQKINIEKFPSRPDLNNLRSSIAYISQDPFLFQGTLKQNLDMNEEHSDEELWKALNQVGLKEWTSSQKHQLNLRIEERGKNLSSGERQLVCMARCLLQKTPIVVMDEATSFVDPQSEEIMVKATQEYFKERTQIIIAHRLSTLEKCDRVLWLHLGEVKTLGPTSEVLKKMESENLNFSPINPLPTSFVGNYERK